MKIIFLATFLIITSTSFASDQSFKELSFKQKSLLSRDLDKAKEIEVFNLSILVNSPLFHMTKLNSNTFFFPNPSGDQFVKASSDIEREVISRSNINSRSAEVATIIAITNDGVINFHDFYSSGHGEKVSSEVLNNAFSVFMEKLFKNMEAQKLKYIQFIHSHPRYEGFSDSKAATFPLNEQDFYSGKVISTQLGGIPLLITAVVANGYSYHAFIQGDRNITKSVFSK